MDALLRAGSGLPALRNLYQRVGRLKELEVGHRFNNGHFPPDRQIRDQKQILMTVLEEHESMRPATQLSQQDTIRFEKKLTEDFSYKITSQSIFWEKIAN
ncbi:hypothetical protein CEXT_73891 [Caerostris extrusa]|uniref:Uncharacterized protein n=1 Tax=Caerostris extrusa TaxID=172846 RepID=A0AAV4PBF2_CAEEX|nr:hypothetical protein CEXT_73891 [Caerostris extrusa]